MFENIGKKIVGVGKGVMRGTQNFSETVSLNARIDECRKDLNNCYCQLGQAYFSRTTSDVPPEYQGIFDRIHMLNQTIVQLQEQIKVIKGIRQCPNCGAEVASNVMFCGNCGYSMPPVNSAQPAWNGPVCAKCGAPLEEGAAFCTNCGAPAAPNPAPFQSDYQPQGAPAGKVCPNCGTQAAPDAAFCNECGTSLLAGTPSESQPAPEAEPETQSHAEYTFDHTEIYQEPEVVAQEESVREAVPPQPAPEKVCPNCGTKLEEDAVFCSECGNRVG